MVEYRFNMTLEGMDSNAPLYVDEALRVWTVWHGKPKYIGDAQFSNLGNTWFYSGPTCEQYHLWSGREDLMSEYLSSIEDEIDTWVNEHMGTHWPTLQRQGPCCPDCKASILRYRGHGDDWDCPICGLVAQPHLENTPTKHDSFITAFREYWHSVEAPSEFRDVTSELWDIAHENG